MFSELSITSNFSFLQGASHPEEYMERGAFLGLNSIAIADVNSVAGIVRAHTYGEKIKQTVSERQRIESFGPPCPRHLKGYSLIDVENVPRLIPAARLIFEEGVSVTSIIRTHEGWKTICKLISKGRLRSKKGECELKIADVSKKISGITLLLHVPQTLPKKNDTWWKEVRHLLSTQKDCSYLVMSPYYDGLDETRFDRLYRLSKSFSLPVVASAFPLMHHGKRRRLADVLNAIKQGKKIEQLGKSALVNAEQRLRSPQEINKLFSKFPIAIKNANKISASCVFTLDQLKYDYPKELNSGKAPSERLSELAMEGLKWRYPQGAPERVSQILNHELKLIKKLEYEPYFLTVNDIVQFARSRNILCQGRGSAANSILCYCLGITSVSPEIGTMVFERFVSEARKEPPDIDVDFEHERREEVIQHIYEKYGRDHAGLCATVVHYRGKRAVREVGTAMGLTKDTISALSSQLWGFSNNGKISDKWLKEIGLNPNDTNLQKTLLLIHEIIGFPRHLSQHVGGFIITEGRLDELVPIENASMEDRTVICWDKDDIDSLGILKIDILSLGMLTCLRKSFDLISQHLGQNFDLANLPTEDPKVYDMLCRADSIGVFQVESRAQMNFLPRMRPRCFYDLVIEVAIVRPGPIQGDMVHPYIRRRSGEEQVEFPSDALGGVLSKTLGVPLFQEQAMQIAIVGAGFSPEEADKLRRALATFKKHGSVSELRTRFLRGMRQNGYGKDFSERCFSQIEGFGSYGFPESHAASFALLVYASAWIKCQHPAVFACALLNSQPMGFYAPAQILNDARAHDVSIYPICINNSYWDNTLETDKNGELALRLGFRQIIGLTKEDASWITAARGNGYNTIGDIWRRAGVKSVTLNRLAEADAFISIGMNQREAIWQASAIPDNSKLPLFDQDIDGEIIKEAFPELPNMSLGESIVQDYTATKFSLRAHPLSLLRDILTPSYQSINN